MKYMQMSAEFFDRIKTNISSLDDPHLVDKMQPIDVSMVEKCQKIIEDMKHQQAHLKNLYDYTNEDMNNLSKVLGSDIDIINLTNTTSELKKLADESEEALKLLFDFDREKFLNEKDITLENVKIKYTRNAIERLKIEKIWLEAELTLLEVRKFLSHVRFNSFILNLNLNSFKENKMRNNERKCQILADIASSDKINQKKEDLRKETDKLRTDFQNKFVDVVNKIQEEQTALINDIKNVRLKYTFHIIDC